jgi:hypothetical protein
MGFWISRYYRVIGIAAFILLVARAVPLQAADSYRSIAVMDFRFIGISNGEMQSVVDRLSLKLLVTQGFRRVVDRDTREQLLREAGRVRRHGSYEKNQLHRAAIIEVDLAVLGEIRMNAGGYQVTVWLLEVKSGDTLYSEQKSYAGKDELIQDIDRLASALLRSSRQSRRAPETERKPLKLDAVIGFRLGQEGVTSAPAIDGGSYLYGEVLAELNRIFGFSLKYSTCLFPYYSANHLITALPRLNIRLADDLYTGLSLGYMLSTDYRSELRQYIGVRLCPIHSGNMMGISIELLPFSVFFDVQSRQPVFMVELMSIAFWLPYKS